MTPGREPGNSPEEIRRVEVNPEDIEVDHERLTRQRRDDVRQSDLERRLVAVNAELAPELRRWRLFVRYRAGLSLGAAAVLAGIAWIVLRDEGAAFFIAVLSFVTIFIKSVDRKSSYQAWTTKEERAEHELLLRLMRERAELVFSLTGKKVSREPEVIPRKWHGAFYVLLAVIMILFFKFTMQWR